MPRAIKVYYKNNLSSIDIDYGEFKLDYNVLRNILGADDGHKLYIKEISNSRKEIRIGTVGDEFPIVPWIQFNNIQDKTDSYCLNFGSNELLLIVNWVFDSEGELGTTSEILASGKGSYVIKLYDKLPSNIKLKDQF